MTSDSSTATITHSAGGGGDGGNSYSLRMSPWVQVVRGGGEPEPVAPRSSSASPSSVLADQNLVFSDQLMVAEPQTAAAVEAHPKGFEGSDNVNANGIKRSAWNKPSENGVMEVTTTPVMGAVSWPALSELTRPLPKSLSFSSESSSKPTSDGSVTVSQAPVITQPPQKLAKTNANNHSNQSHTHPVRARRGGGTGGGGYNRLAPPLPPPMLPFVPFDMSYGSFAPRPMGGVGSHSHAMHNQSSNRKRSNFGPSPHGDGGFYPSNGYGGRCNHPDRDWRGPRSHATIPPHQMVPPPPRGYTQQSHLGSAPFISPQPVRSCGTPMGYEMAAPLLYVSTLPPVPYRGAPLLPHATTPSIFTPVMDPPLPILILNQIEYYFSDANLVKDNFLKSNMDEEGWVPIALIAGFRRVQSLTSDVQLILNSLRDSSVVEVQGDKVRRWNEWQKWMRPSDNFAASGATDSSVVDTWLTELSLNESTTNKEGPSKTCSAGFTDSSKMVNVEVSTEDDSTKL